MTRAAPGAAPRAAPGASAGAIVSALASACASFWVAMSASVSVAGAVVISYALLAGCLALVHRGASADPMRPLVLPGAISAAANAASAAAATAGTDTAARSARSSDTRDGSAARRPQQEPERLVAIRQDSDSRWLALFGERWVRSGDKVERYTVGAIDGNSVQLTEGRQKKTLNLLPPLSAPTPVPATTTGALAGVIAPRPAGSATHLAQANAAAPSAQRAAGLSPP